MKTAIFSDWIEIHNPDGSEVDLDGYFLTDKASNLDKWRIPAVTIPAGGYLVIFASDKDRSNPEVELHTSFKPPFEKWLPCLGCTRCRHRPNRLWLDLPFAI